MGKLTSGEITIRVILLVHAFWRTLSTVTVLVPIIVFLAWVLLWWAWKTTTSQDVNSLFSVSSKAFGLIWGYDRLFLSRRFPIPCSTISDTSDFSYTHTRINTQQQHTPHFTEINVKTIHAISNNTNSKNTNTTFLKRDSNWQKINFLILVQFETN